MADWTPMWQDLGISLKCHDELLEVLTIETDYSDDTGQLRTRVEAFLETLETP